MTRAQPVSRDDGARRIGQVRARPFVGHPHPGDRQSVEALRVADGGNRREHPHRQRRRIPLEAVAQVVHRHRAPPARQHLVDERPHLRHRRPAAGGTRMLGRTQCAHHAVQG